MTEQIAVGTTHLTDGQLEEYILKVAWTALHSSRDRFAGWEAVASGDPVKVPKWRFTTPQDGPPQREQVGEEWQQAKMGREVLLPANKAVSGERLLFTTTFGVEECAMDILGLGSRSPDTFTPEEQVAVDSYMYRLCHLCLRLHDMGWISLRVYRSETLISHKETEFDWASDPQTCCWSYTYQGLTVARARADLRGWEAAPNRGAISGVEPLSVTTA